MKLLDRWEDNVIDDPHSFLNEWFIFWTYEHEEEDRIYFGNKQRSVRGFFKIWE